MKKIKYIFKAVVIIGIALAFVMPGAAMVANRESVAIEQPAKYSSPKILGMSPGWEEQASGFWEPSRGIDYMCAVDENIVWAKNYDGSGGGEIIREFTLTTNGGELWEANAMFGTPDEGDPAMIFGLDADHAWVPLHSGDPQGIWATDDGGSTWVHQATAAYSGTGAFPNFVHFWDVDNGWCQGDPVDGYYEMYTTTDGGVNWIRTPSEDIPAPQSGEYGVEGYYDVVGDTVWWSTTQGRVYKSTDRGYTWTVTQSVFNNYMNIRFLNENDGLIWLMTATGYGDLAETHDGGETWDEVETSGYYCGYHFSSVPGTAATWISTSPDVDGNPGASYSLDGGHTWTQYTDDPVYNTQVLACDFIEGGIGWAGGFNEDEFIGGMYKYTPGENLPPGAPTIDGETHGHAGTEYDYTFNAVDPNGDTVRYHIDWGDTNTNVTDYNASGADVIVPHTWTTQDTFTITAYAEDDKGLTGPSNTLVVTMPRSKAVQTSLFLRILENHPNLFPILQLLLQRLGL